MTDAPASSARTPDIFDPFDHGDAGVPNLLRPEDARMLSAGSAHMLSDDPTTMVDPDEAIVVDPDDAVVVDPAAAVVVDPDAAVVVDPDRARVVATADTTDHASPTLALIGAPGSGKSTVGRAVARLLGVPFCDVDATIEQDQGRTIGEIFADDGEPAFRRLEEDATLAALEQAQVVALGGGAVMSPKVRAALAPHPVVWLEVQAATAIGRAGLNQARPLLLGNVRGTLIKLLAERTPVYRSLATVVVPNDGDDAEETASRVVGELARHRLARGEA